MTGARRAPNGRPATRPSRSGATEPCWRDRPETGAGVAERQSRPPREVAIGGGAVAGEVAVGGPREWWPIDGARRRASRGRGVRVPPPLIGPRTAIPRGTRHEDMDQGLPFGSDAGRRDRPRTADACAALPRSVPARSQRRALGRAGETPSRASRRALAVRIAGVVKAWGASDSPRSGRDGGAAVEPGDDERAIVERPLDAAAESRRPRPEREPKPLDLRLHASSRSATETGSACRRPGRGVAPRGARRARADHGSGRPSPAG